MNTTNLNRRKNFVARILFGNKIFLINRNFQFRFMAYTVLTVVLSLSLFYLANYFFFESFIEKGRQMRLPENHAFFLILKEQQLLMAKIFTGLAIVTSTFLMITGLLFSHKIAGPLYRLNKMLREASENKQKLRNLYFREGDFFQEIPEAINLYLNSHEECEPPQEEIEKPRLVN